MWFLWWLKFGVAKLSKTAALGRKLCVPCDKKLIIEKLGHYGVWKSILGSGTCDCFFILVKVLNSEELIL